MEQNGSLTEAGQIELVHIYKFRVLMAGDYAVEIDGEGREIAPDVPKAREKISMARKRRIKDK